MFSTYFKNRSTMSQQQRQDYERQEREDRQKETEEWEQQKLKAEARKTQKRLREIEARLKSTRGPGRPKKVKPDAADNASNHNSATDTRAVNIIQIGCLSNSQMELRRMKRKLILIESWQQQSSTSLQQAYDVVRG